MNLLFMQNGLAPYGIPRSGLIALYDPGRQILTGTTGQTLVDYTGRGNNAQLGSTAGADTNDPAWNGGLVFGADDYCKSSSPAFDDMAQFTCITVCKPLSSGGGNTGRIWDKSAASTIGHAFVIGVGKPTLYLYTTLTSNTHTFGQSVSYNTNNIIGISGNISTPTIVSNGYINNIKQTITVAGTGTVIKSDKDTDLYIGNRSDAIRNFDGTIYLQLWYNRILSDAEYMQAYNGLSRLMNSRGVVI